MPEEEDTLTQPSLGEAPRVDGAGMYRVSIPMVALPHQEAAGMRALFPIVCVLLAEADVEMVVVVLVCVVSSSRVSRVAR